MEEWKDIIGFEGQYMVSNTGQVKSLARVIAKGKMGQRFQSELILKPSISKVGYSRVRIGPELIAVHRLVAMHFVTNPDNKNIVNHKDGVKLNNNADNLEWCTNTENQRHAWATGLKKPLKGEKNPYAKISDAVRNQVIQLYREGWRMCELAKKFALTNDYVNKIIRRSGFHEKRARPVTFTGERKKAYYRNYQYMWQRRRKERMNEPNTDNNGPESKD